MANLAHVAMLVVAAGRGARMGVGAPKQYRPLGARPVLAETLARAALAEINPILTLIHADDGAAYAEAARLSNVAPTRLTSATGGASRQASVRLGLEALAAAGFPEDGLVLIHDAARPFLNEAVLLRAILAGARHEAAIPVLPVADTLATLDEAGMLATNPDRASMRIVQTPQVFRFGLIHAAHQRFKAQDGFTDDASLACAAGHDVATFAGDADLFKITQEADLARATLLLQAGESESRSGIGYDVHAFTEGDHVMLGGVKMPHNRALLGHSDADPVLHALTDALLGTIGDGDIGVHFPPSDEKWRGASSRVFLEEAARRVLAAGGRILHVDTMILSEAPKIGPYRAAITGKIAEILGLSEGHVGVKATTMEGLGFIGRREGIAALAIATVRFGRG